MFAEVDVNQDGASSVSMYFDIQDEPGGISGIALNSSATGDSSQNWSTAPLWTSVNPNDLIPEVGGPGTDSLHNVNPVTTFSSIFQWDFTLNADPGEQVTSIELDGLQVSGSNFSSFDVFVLGDGWSDVIPATSFSSPQTIVLDRLYDSAFDPDVVGGDRLFLAITYSAQVGVDTLRMFEEDAGLTTDRFRITVNYTGSVPEPGALGFLAAVSLVFVSRRRQY